MMRVRPYYLYQCDLVEGAGHFRTTVNKGIEIMEGLRGHTSGYAVPTYVIDAPGGGGKIPVAPNYVVSAAPGKVVLRNFEGFLTTYSEPTDYDPEAIRHLDAQASRRPEPGQSGVLGLLEGERMTIEPEGFSSIHVRGDGHQHRLNADQHKWQPLGIGGADTPAIAAGQNVRETAPDGDPTPEASAAVESGAKTVTLDEKGQVVA
jgi:lysine 2,3-aminomutase